MQNAARGWLEQVQFHPGTVGFTEGRLEGELEIAGEVSEAFVQNLHELFVGGIDFSEEARVVVNPTHLMTDSPMATTGTPAIEASRNSTVETLSYFHAAMADEKEIAGFFEMKLKLVRLDEDQRAHLTVQPVEMSVQPQYAQSGHSNDLLAAACWMLQDVVASLILNAPEAVTWDFAMCTLEVPHANAGLIEQALYETLDRASKAMTLDRATDAGTVHTVQFEKALPKVV